MEELGKRIGIGIECKNSGSGGLCIGRICTLYDRCYKTVDEKTGLEIMGKCNLEEVYASGRGIILGRSRGSFVPSS